MKLKLNLGRGAQRLQDRREQARRRSDAGRCGIVRTPERIPADPEGGAKRR